MINRWITRLVVIIVVIGIWEVLTLDANPYLFPSPTGVLNAAVTIFRGNQLLGDTASTLMRLMIGFVAGGLLGALLGLIIGGQQQNDGSEGFFVHFLRFIPPLAIVPLVILWFGIGEFSKILIIGWTVFFPVYVSTALGVSRVNQKYWWLAKSLDFSKKRILSRIILPASVPFVINGLRVGMGIAFSVIIAAEMAGAFFGMGYRLWFFHAVFRADEMMVYLFLLGMMGLAFDYAFRVFSNRFLFGGNLHDH